jgi:NAD(P)H-dependent FMN reductase
MQKLFIPVLVGTTRTQRKSIEAARFIKEIGNSFDELTTELVDPLDFHFPGDGNDFEGKDPRYSMLTKKADGFFIVSPEYNHSFPGSLKRMLDSELENYIHKAVAFAGASSGPWGGIRAIEALVLTTREMGMVSTFSDVHFPQVQNLFDAQGNVLDSKYIDRVKSSWTELIWMTRVLKQGIEAIPSQYHAKN